MTSQKVLILNDLLETTGQVRTDFMSKTKILQLSRLMCETSVSVYVGSRGHTCKHTTLLLTNVSGAKPTSENFLRCLPN